MNGREFNEIGFVKREARDGFRMNRDLMDGLPA
jgi:hypothetical protein